MWRTFEKVGLALIGFPPMVLLGLWITTWFVLLDAWHSTDRYCISLRIAKGGIDLHYDGGPDVLIVKPRTIDFCGLAYNSPAPRWGGSWQQVNLALPIWMPFLVCLLPPVAFFVARPIRRRRRIRRRIRRGLCQKCGYDLRGNTSGVCPECGQIRTTT